MPALSTIIRASVAAQYTDDQTIVALSAPLAFEKVFSWFNGTAIDQADKIYMKRDAVTNGAPDTIDLAGSLTDVFGNALTFAKVTAIIVSNRSTTAAEIMTIGAGTNPLLNWVIATGDGVKIGPGGLFMQVDPSLAGYAVTAGTGDVLQISVAAGTAVPYDMVVIGRSA